MHKYVRYIKFLILVLVSPGLSQAAEVDLSLEITPAAINDIQAGEIGVFSVTVTNNSFEDAGVNGVTNFPISIDTGIFVIDSEGLAVDFTIDFGVEQNCVFFQTFLDPRPGNLPGVIYSFFTPVIPAHSSITCHGLYLTNFERGFESVEWTVLNVLDTDPDESNNSVTMDFFGQVTAVPTLSIIFILLLVVLLVLGAAIQCRSVSK